MNPVPNSTTYVTKGWLDRQGRTDITDIQIILHLKGIQEKPLVVEMVLKRSLESDVGRKRALLAVGAGAEDGLFGAFSLADWQLELEAVRHPLHAYLPLVLNSHLRSLSP